MSYNPTYYPNADFVVQRQYCNCFAIAWWSHTVISAVNKYKVEEIPYGGYSIQVNLHDEFYAWASAGWKLSDIIGTIIVRDQQGTLVNGVNFTISYYFNPICQVFTLGVEPDSGDHTTSVWRLPAAPTDYWYQPYPKPSWTYLYRTEAEFSLPCPPDDLPVT